MIKTLIDNTTLHSLVQTENDMEPATFIRGKNCIDFMLGTNKVKESIVAAGYLPFYAGAWDSDHRALFVDLKAETLFGKIDEQPLRTIRSLRSTNKIKVEIFMEKLSREKALAEILTKLEALKQKQYWEPKDHESLEEFDSRFTKILIDTENKCRQNRDPPWSIKLHIANRIVEYWKIKLKGKTNRVRVRQQLDHILSRLHEPEVIWQDDKKRPPKHLKEARDNAWELRQEYLIKLYSEYEGKNDNKKAKIVRRIYKSEARTRCYSTCQNINNPRSNEGGLTNVITQTKEGEVRIENKEEVENVLHSRNVVHFAQAKNTPCASGEIARVLEENGVNTAASDILNNKIVENISEQTREMFNELKQKRNEMSNYLPFVDMVNGFHRWKEATTTSPSGKHLGIYKTLTKIIKKQEKK
jgi:hypothetical protein